MHPARCQLPVVLEGQCPVVSAELCLELIRELETKQHQQIARGLELKVLKSGEANGEMTDVKCSWGSEQGLLEWIRKLLPDDPERILAQALPGSVGHVWRA